MVANRSGSFICVYPRGGGEIIFPFMGSPQELMQWLNTYQMFCFNQKQTIMTLFCYERQGRIMPRTEFYESAVKHGFYGVDKSGLFGKKDNVRKYWEDVSIKLSIRPAIEQVLGCKDKIRIVDLGCGSGEGVELLTHIPPTTPVKTVHKEFVITEENIEIYKGVDILCISAAGRICPGGFVRRFSFYERRPL
jgi:hypothetical protein